MRTFIIALALFCFSAATYAHDTGALLSCSTETDDERRLACFDATMKMLVTPQTSSVAVITEEPTTSTKEIVAAPISTEPTTSDSFKLIDPNDLYVSPAQYESKPIEMRRMRCLHAYKKEYRCIAPGALALMIISPEIRSTNERKAIEKDCTEVIKMVSAPQCEKTLRFIPQKNDEGLVNGKRKRVVVVTSYIEVVPKPSRSKR